MPSLSLGNSAVVEVVKTERGTKVTEKVVDRSDLGSQVCEITFPADLDFTGQLATIESLWPAHSSAPPAWVESDDDLLAQAVARRFTSDDHACAVGRPSGWQEG